MASSPSQGDLKSLLNDAAVEAVDTPDFNSETTEGSSHRQRLELINDAMTAMLKNATSARSQGFSSTVV